MTLVACGGGGGGGSTNRAPVASAGAAQTVASGVTVVLNGSASTDPDGSVSAYQWSQTSGTPVSLSNAGSAQPSFVAPTVTSAITLTFSLVVTDNQGLSSTAASVTITVSAPAVTLAGTVRYARAPVVITSTVKLNYGSPEFMPARGVVVRVLDANTQTVLASGVTLDDGSYSLNVPGNTSVTVQAEARLLSSSLPTWNIRVQNGTGTTQTPYRYTGAVINSTGGSGDLNIPLGINATGTATGTRDSGPFAILDTIYTALQVVITAMPTASFPTLYVDWGAQKDGAFFSVNSGLHIALRADLTEDTDEFDQPVIAHEFGHYLQYAFARSDSIGGNHGLGDRLDLRVAFNEGFATGFAAIALDDPIYYDTFVLPDGSLVGGGYYIETNPATNPPADQRGLGCWCNEASVWSLVWDLYDGNIEANDSVALPFFVIWQAMIGSNSTTSAFVSIFSYIRALKAIRPGDVAAIDTLVAAQNITAATIDDFAPTETHSPFPAALPVYTDIFKGTPVVVHSIDDGGPNAEDGDYNKLGARPLLRYVAQTSGNITITVTTSNPNTDADPDFVMYRAGVPLSLGACGQNPIGQCPPNDQRNEVATNVAVVAGTTYVIDAYDCANGCTTVQGTAGDYDLTVSIQ